MKKQQILLILYLLSALILVLYILGPIFNIISPSIKNPEEKIPFKQIYIGNNQSFNESTGVIKGDGTHSNPYIIEGYDIETEGIDAIKIENTGRYFIIRNCTIHSNTVGFSVGIWINNVKNGTIENVTINGCYIGILVSSSIDIKIIRCIISKSSVDGIQLAGKPSYITIILCEIRLNKGNGIFLDTCYNCIISNNKINSNNQSGISTVLVFTTNINQNVINNNQYGIRMESSHYNNLTGNNISKNRGIGISQNVCISNNCSDNEISNNIGVGFSIQGISTKNSQFYNNKVWNNSEGGVYIGDCTASKIINNKIFMNLKNGIIIYGDRTATKIVYNTISDNELFGIYLESKYNRVYKNNFMSNNNLKSPQAFSIKYNFWNSTESFGNYWSDYTIRYPDANVANNWWSTPYLLDASLGQFDYFPSVNPIKI